MKCLLCESTAAAEFHKKTDPNHGPRTYYKCPDCLLIFVSPKGHISPEEEKHRYDQHQNTPENAGYVTFLLKLIEPLAARLKPGSEGLDFGCGPLSVTKLLFEERGHSMDVYDPYFFPDQAVLRRQYDFVACTEVIEHFRTPRQDFTVLDRTVRSKGGRLGIMTQFIETEKDFGDWWYQKDPTHICFYRKETLQWIAGWKRLVIEFPEQNVALFLK